MSDLNEKIHARIDAFVGELQSLVRAAALESVQRALGGSPKAVSHSKAPTAVAGLPARGSALSKRRKGEKRDPGLLAKTVENLAAYVTTHPGQRLEDIAKGLALPSNDLKLPVIKLLADKTITKKGQKRGTKYFPARSGK